MTILVATRTPGQLENKNNQQKQIRQPNTDMNMNMTSVPRILDFYLFPTLHTDLPKCTGQVFIVKLRRSKAHYYTVRILCVHPTEVLHG